MSEFDLIEQLFQGHHRDAQLGVGDDAALLSITADTTLAISTDTLVDGVHFPSDMSARAIGHRILAVNLSDMAAMGAKPRWFTLALTMPEHDVEWARELTDGLLQLAERYEVGLIGGDTTRGPLSLTVTILGETQLALSRQGAKPGDRIWIGGNPGDAAGGLELWSQRQQRDQVVETLIRRFEFPDPQVALGQRLVGMATAAIDVSDGLIADLRHVCQSSGCGAEINLDELPLSASLLSQFSEAQARTLALGGGDDYLLLFTAPPQHRFEDCFSIGVMTDTSDIQVLDSGQPLDLEISGYEHF